MNATTLDAASAWPSNSHNPVILLSRDKDRNSAVRRRFDAAHELAHLLLHKNVDQSLLRSETTYYKEIERQAHRFAGAFLFPKDSFLKEVFLVKLDALVPLKPKWKVSVGVMLKRAEHLGLIDDRQKQALWRNLARRGWRTCEPYDSVMEWEEPQLLSEGFKAIVNNEIMRAHDILSVLPLRPRELESMCWLDHGFFDGSPPTVEIIDFA